MKNITRGSGFRGVLTAALVVALVFVLSQSAFAGGNPPKGIDPDNHNLCHVGNDFWTTNTGSDGISLRTAIQYANSGSHHSCRERISIHPSQQVQMKTPLVITRENLIIDGSLDENGDPVFDSAGKLMRATLDVKNMDANKKTDGEDGNGCAIYIEAAGVQIRNLVLSGTSSQSHGGICFAGDDNKIDNVTIRGGKNAIVFTAASSANRILPNVRVSSAGGFGIVDDSSGQNGNIVIMNNFKSALEGGTEGNEVVDMDGFVNWVDGEYFDVDQLLMDPLVSFFTGTGSGSDPMKISLAGQMGLLKTSQRLVMPLITEIDIIATKKKEVRGIFKEVTLPDDYDGSEPIPKQNCNGVPDGGVDRLALFAIEGGKMVYKATVGMNLAFGVDTEEGDFRFFLDAETNPELQDVENFILVPVNKQWQIVGRASEYKELATLDTDCEEGTGPDGVTNGGGGSGGDMGVMEYETLAECNEDMAFMSGYCDSTKDSDADGIPDCVEMGTFWDSDYDADTADPDNPLGAYIYDFKQGNCTCTGTVTCWYKIDTDYDGVPDGADNGNIDWWSGLVGYNSGIHGPKVITKIQDNDLGIDLARLPDMRDDDSDEDGLPDGHEDRSRTFQPYDYLGQPMTAYFKKFGTSGSGTTYYKNTAGNKVECDLSDWDGAPEIGVRWGIFRAGGDEGYFIDVPTEYTVNYMDGSTPDLDTAHGQVLAVMACVNDTVGGEQSFDGSHQKSNGETNARSADSDGDCVCDWNGAGCKAIDGSTSTHFAGQACKNDVHGTIEMDTVATPQWYNDRCPNKGYITNDCSPECLADEVLQAVAYNPHGREWLKPHPTEEGEVLLQMRDDGHKGAIANNGIKDLFEQTVTETDPETSIEWTRPDYGLVYNACSDMDKDGIPDCLERWEPNCNPVSVSNFLDPYEEDSDFDGYVDGVGKGGKLADVCPFENEPGYDDAFTDVNPNYSCSNPLHLLGQGNTVAMLGCFVDRDGDGVIDCFEDRDMNGSIASSQATTNDDFSAIFSAESNPLDPDSDDDGLSDYLEVIEGWPYRTNPNRADTDGDGLSDALEDHDNNELIDDAMYEGQGCSIGLMNDTDPRMPDTDRDGLSDGVEVDGPVVSDDNFLLMIQDTTNWTSGGILHGSSPLSIDSDNDGLTDAEEYNGNVITYYDSNPCMIDSDGDTRNDVDEPIGCRLNPNHNCIGIDDPDAAFGLDSDSDGLTDALEVMLGTDPNNPDTDGDEVWDGIEDANRNGIYESALGESNPIVADTDADGLSDGFELRYGTDPTNTDTDGDCIADGIEDANRNGQYDMGTETDARSSDTDSDGLPDGWIASSGLGEDINCNGIRDTDADGRYLETDPRNPDSDMDGVDDFTEMTHGGYFNLNNMDRSTTGRDGCSLAGSAGAAPSGMMLLIGLALAVARLRRREEISA